MDFYESQRQAKKWTWYLVALFVVNVLAVAYLVAVIVVEFFGMDYLPGQEYRLAVFIALAIGAISARRMLKMRTGSDAVMAEIGARPLPPGAADDPRYRQLVNIVDEIAIATRIPRPKLFILEQEPSINAFAFGFTPADSAIGVTRGAIERLSRSELAGVIGHEFGHIVQGDTRLNTVLFGLLAGLFAVAVFGQKMISFGAAVWEGSSKSDKTEFRFGGMAAGAFFCVLGMLIALTGAIGRFAGMVIQAAVSRNREFLADASAVQFTRDNTGIAGALLKIAASSEQKGSRLASARASEVNHLLLSDGVGLVDNFLAQILASHPPTEERISQLIEELTPERQSLIRDRLKACGNQWNRLNALSLLR